MNTIAKKAKEFNKIFSKEEKVVIILGSIATLLTVALGLLVLMSLVNKVFHWYVDLTAPYVINALNKLVGALFEGWRFI